MGLSIEGRLVTGRTLRKTERELHFNRELFVGQRILNFGCGGSNISNEIRKAQVNAELVVDFDMHFDPSNRIRKFLTYPLHEILEGTEMLTDQDSRIHRTSVAIRRRLGNIQNRTFVQGDGRNLPFEDNAFDTAIAPWSTYQIPTEAKRQVFKELLRVSKATFFFPIGGDDFDILQQLAKDNGYEIIYSGSHLNKDLKINSIEDYDAFRDSYTENQRVQRPSSNPTSVIKLGSKILGARVEGNLVIMRRKLASQ